MATRAQIAYYDESNDSIISTYNHWDGYPENLGVALKTHYNSGTLAKEIANKGYISYVNPDDGEIDVKGSNQNSSPAISIGSEEYEVLSRWYDVCTGESANYAYLWTGQEWNEYNMSEGRQTEFVEYFMDKMGMGTSDEMDYDSEEINTDEQMNEDFETKWDNFLHEGEGKLTGFKDALRDEHQPHVTAYLASVENDIRLNGGSDYMEFSDEDVVEDFENYIADKTN
jgi:hypothetical protein